MRMEDYTSASSKTISSMGREGISGQTGKNTLVAGQMASSTERVNLLTQKVSLR